MSPSAVRNVLTLPILRVSPAYAGLMAIRGGCRGAYPSCCGVFYGSDVTMVAAPQTRRGANDRDPGSLQRGAPDASA